jgi:hypothetical protein
MRGRTCWFPARICSLTLGLAWFVFTGATAAYSWLILSQAITNVGSVDPNALTPDSLHVILTNKQRILLYIIAGVYSASFFICGIGLLSILVRARKFVIAFLTLICLETVTSLAVSAFELYELWGNSADNCSTGINVDSKAACISGIANLRVALTAAFALTLAIQLWLAHALYVLLRVMREEKAYEELAHWHAARIPSKGAATSPFAFDPFSEGKLNFSVDFDPSRASKLGSPYPPFTSKTRLNFNARAPFDAPKLGFNPARAAISTPTTALVPEYPSSGYGRFPSPSPSKLGFDAAKLGSPQLGDDYADPYYKRENFAFRVDLPARGSSRTPRKSWWGRPLPLLNRV